MQNQGTMWEKINVWQYQQIYNALNSKDKDATDLDLKVKLVAIVNNMTEMQVDSLPLDEYKELSKTIEFLNEPIKGKPVKWIPITKNKRYRIVYDVSKIPYDASKHQEYADDMLNARFIDVYNSLVFFYQVYRNWIEVSRGYLANKLKETGMTTDKANEVVQSLCNILDGNIAPNLLPTTKIAELRKHMK